MCWLCCLNLMIKEEAHMKNINANLILPAELVEELAKRYCLSVYAIRKIVYNGSCRVLL